MRLEKVYFKPTGWTLLKGKELLRGNSEAIKLYLMHETLEAFLAGIIYYSLMFKLAVKRWITFLFLSLKNGSRQCAWDLSLIMFSTHQRLNVEYPNNKIYDHSKSINKSKYNENGDNFNQWLVGVTDGDGSFTISRLSEGKWTLFFKVTQSTYNLRMLYFIKTQLGAGSVNTTANNQKADFRIRDRKTIGSIIIPIFDKYPLLTYKFKSYELFKKAYYLLENKNLDREQLFLSLVELEAELNRLLNFKINKINQDLVNPYYSDLNIESRYENIISVISKFWLIGFVETKGRFIIVILDNEFKFEFYIEQKQDELLLFYIKRILHIKNVVRSPDTFNNFVLSTRGKYAIDNIIKYFSNSFIGINSLIFNIWSRAYLRNNNQTKLKKSYLLLTKLNNKLYTQLENTKVPLNIRDVKRASYPKEGGSSFNVVRKRFYSSGPLLKTEVSPVIVYSNISKEKFLLENRNKCGIYRFTNKLNGKSYVGSSIDLSKRFSQYFSRKVLLNRRFVSIIYQAILKYKHENFKLEILEYCDKKDVLVREQFYLDLLKPSRSRL